MFPPHRSRVTASVLTAGIAALAAIAATTSPAVARSVPAPQVATGECLTGVKPDKPTPISSTRVVEIQGRVDIRGSLKVKKGKIGPLVVKGCASGIKPLVSRTYVLEKAPSSNRYIVALTKWTTAEGAAGAEAAPRLTTEAAFGAAISPLVQVLIIPGIKGTVYGPVGSPFALMATKASGKPYSRKAKLALAKNYIATGGYAVQPDL